MATGPTAGSAVVTDNLAAVVGYGALVGVGVLLLVAAIREFQLFLAAGGPDPGVTVPAVLALAVTGATLLVAGAMKAVALAVATARQ